MRRRPSLAKVVPGRYATPMKRTDYVKSAAVSLGILVVNMLLSVLVIAVYA